MVRQALVFVFVLVLVTQLYAKSLRSAVNVTCSVVENVRQAGLPVCSLRDELLRRGQIDDGMQLRYELVPMSNTEALDVSLFLELNASTGLFSTASPDIAQPLDRERTPQFDLIVFVDNARSPKLPTPVPSSAAGFLPRLPHSLVVNVRLYVLDENDNAPVWPMPTILLNFTEAETRNASRSFVLASDRDVGNNAKIVYRKQNVHVTFANATSTVVSNESDEPFRFSIVRRRVGGGNRKEVEMGALTLLRQLDAESISEYRFDLIAIDNNGLANASLSSTATVVVKVVDINEFAPSFVFERRAATAYVVNVSESHGVESPILTLFATDADADADADAFGGVDSDGEAWRITYSVVSSSSSSSDVQQSLDSSGQPLVTVSEHSGELFLRERLDYEALQDAAKRIYVVLQAVDSGVPTRLTASATVTINVLDENDNAPEIRISCTDEPLVAGPLRNVLTLEENADLGVNGETDCRITAIDADSGVFGQVHCAVGASVSGHFALVEQHANRRTPIYRLKLLQPFDYESVRQLDVPISCADGHNRSSSSVISVVISDVNDCAPTFPQSSYVAQITENSSPGTFVTQLRAVDRDTTPSGAQVRYAIVAQSVVDADSPVLFSVDELGVVRVGVGVTLDRERVERVLLTVRASDSANASLHSTTQLTVDVADVNDSPPVTRLVHSFAVSEDVPTGSPVGTLAVSDPDSSLSQRLSFDVLGAECSSVFRFSPDGRGNLLTAVQLDRENKPTYLCDVDVGDGVFRVRTLVNVSVLDANDHAPVFTFPSGSNSTVLVPLPPASLAPGTVLARVAATDADAGANAAVRYYLQHSSDLFEISEVSGELRLKRAVQVGDGVRRHLLIRASDQGSQPQSSTAVLTLLIGSSTGQDGGVHLESTAPRGTKAVWDGVALSDSMMNVLVTVSLVAVSVCLLATVLVVLFLIWKRYGKAGVSRRQNRKRCGPDNGHGHGHGHGHVTSGAKRPVSIIDRQLFNEPMPDQPSTPMLSFSVTNDLPSQLPSSFTEEPSFTRPDPPSTLAPPCPLKRNAPSDAAFCQREIPSPERSRQNATPLPFRHRLLTHDPQSCSLANTLSVNTGRRVVLYGTLPRGQNRHNTVSVVQPSRPASASTSGSVSAHKKGKTPICPKKCLVDNSRSTHNKQIGESSFKPTPLYDDDTFECPSASDVSMNVSSGPALPHYSVS